MTGILLSVALLLGTTQTVAAQPPPGLRIVKEHPPAHDDFKKTLDNFETWLIKLDDSEYYPEFEFKNVSSGKVRKVSDLTPVERKAFFCMQAENMERKLRRFVGEWTELEASLKAKEAVIPEVEEPEDNCGWFWKLFEPKPLSSADVKKYKEQLMALRPKAAARHEALVEKMYKDHADLFTKDEAEAHVRTLRERHDSEKLIERPKK